MTDTLETVPLRWLLKEFMRDNRCVDGTKLNALRLHQITGLSTNTIYPIARGEVKQIEMKTLDTILAGLSKLTGKTVILTDILHYEPLSHLPASKR